MCVTSIVTRKPS